MSNDSKFQELVRVLDATLANVNPDGLITGHNTVSIIRFLSSFEGMNSFISPDLHHLINDLATTDGKDNVRGPVKKILMYPLTQYPPWNDIGIQFTESPLFRFQICLLEGKVYAACISIPNLTDYVFDTVNLVGFKKNKEKCHITLVNSNIVYDLGMDRVKQFIANWQEEFPVVLGKVKTTESLDWSPFKECAVVEVSSDYLTNFINAFGALKSIKPSTHVTFASKSRDLFQ